MFLGVEMVAVVEGALVAAFQDGRLLLIGADAVPPVRFAGREFQDADTVCADGTMEESRRRMLLLRLLELRAGTPRDADAPLGLAAQLVAEERATVQQLVALAVARVHLVDGRRRWNGIQRHFRRRRETHLRLQFAFAAARQAAGRAGRSGGGQRRRMSHG